MSKKSENKREKRETFTPVNSMLKDLCFSYKEKKGEKNQSQNNTKIIKM